MSTADSAGGAFPVFVLTCSKSPAERLLSARRQLDALSVPLDVRIVDGFLGDDPQIETFLDRRQARWRTKRQMSGAEVAIYGGHRKVWRQLIESTAEAALVLEDDFTITDEPVVIAAIMQARSLLSDGRHIVKLFDFEKRRETGVFERLRVGGVEIVRWQSPTAGAVAYLMSREAAVRLLSRERVFRPVDEDFKYWWEFGLGIWSVRGNPVVDGSRMLGGSLVEADRERMKSRSFARSLWGNLLTLDRKWRNSFHLARARRARRG